MRAKLKVTKVDVHPVENSPGSETVHFRAIGPDDPYPADGSDENNTYAKWTPSAELHIQITNPALLGKHKEGDVFYVDFTPVPA